MLCHFSGEASSSSNYVECPDASCAWSNAKYSVEELESHRIGNELFHTRLIGIDIPALQINTLTFLRGAHRLRLLPR